MLVFYLWEKLRGVPEAVIWEERYFLPEWQVVFDAVSSLPLIGACWLVARSRERPLLQLFFLSLGLHSATDLLTHGADAHRHFWPLSWRFDSPVSYWDPSRYGWIVFPLEALMVIGGTLWLHRRWRSLQNSRPGRTILTVNGAVYLAVMAYAAVMWA